MSYAFTSAPERRRSAPVPTIELGRLDCGPYHFGPRAPVETPRPVSDWRPLPHQVAPPGEGWDTWVTLGGRGSGKTNGAVHYVLDHLRELGSKARVGIGAPGLAEVRDICAEGESGLITTAPDEFRDYHRSIGYCEAWHIDGGYVRFMGSEKSRNWNGPSWSLLWWDEWALINFDSYRESRFGLRLGRWPRTIITTTPKAISMTELIALTKRAGVVSRTVTTYDNPHLPERRKAEFERDYGGTTLGQSELMGEMVFDTEGALWKHAWIDDARRSAAPELARIVVALDPAGGNGNQSAETGIAAAGRGVDGEFYVLALEGVQLSPHEWFARGCSHYDELKADALVVEQNYGGPFIREMAKRDRPDVNCQMVSATRGKTVRAEPIAALYQQGKVHHVGLFVEGEGQMCSFPLARRKDMTDAVVWALTALQAPQSGSFGDMPGYVTPAAGASLFRSL